MNTLMKSTLKSNLNDKFIDINNINVLGPPISSNNRILFHQSKINYENKQQTVNTDNNNNNNNMIIENLKVDEFHDILQYTKSGNFLKEIQSPKHTFYMNIGYEFSNIAA
jgi:hypothetical protein